jgi:hypothetical protein
LEIFSWRVRAERERYNIFFKQWRRLGFIEDEINELDN